MEDLVLAHWQAYEYLLDKKVYFEDFNLGSEVGTSNLEMIKTFEKVIQQKIPFDFAPPREGDPAMLVASSAKAKMLLGFKTTYLVKDCLEHTLNYFQHKRKEYLP